MDGGEVVEVTGPVSYKVRLDSNGTMCRRHQNQLRKGPATEAVPDQRSILEDDAFRLPMTVHNGEENPHVLVDQHPQAQRKSTRVRRAPDKLNL